MAGEKLEFVTISLSKKQINMDPIHNKKNGKDYLRIIAPNGGTIFYPASGIKIDPKDENRVFFSRPKGTEITICYGVKNKETGKWDNKTHVVTIEDLKEMYAEEIHSLIEQHQFEQQNGTSAFVDFTVPTSWGREFKGKTDGKQYVSISVPIKEDDNTRNYYSFVLPADRFKPSQKQEGMSYFGLPRMQKDHPDQGYMIIMKKSVLDENGNYSDVERRVTSTELKGFVDDAMRSMKFVGIEISQKLVRPFTAKTSGQDLVSVSVPIPAADQQSTEFWQIVLPPDRIRESKKEGLVYLSLFRKNVSGEDFTYKATCSAKNEGGTYDVKEKSFTSEEIVGFFKASRQEYLEQRKNNQRALQDEIDNNYGQNFYPDADNPFEKANEAEQHRPEQSVPGPMPINHRQGR